MSSLRIRVWNWLPTFLEIAESGSVLAASKRLHVTSAAVSRTLRLLEDELGEQLFNRVGRSLILNARGEHLRRTMLDATSRVDTGLRGDSGTAFAGPLRVASLGVLTDEYVVPELIEFKGEYPQSFPEHENLRPLEAADALVRGRLDVAFFYEALDLKNLAVEKIGDTTMSVYCGKGHPLYTAKRVTKDAILEHPFSVPQVGDSGRSMDGWPPEWQRQVGMRITMLRSNLQVCLSGTLLTMLPDVTALPLLKSKKLRRLPFKGLPEIEIYAAQRVSETEGGAARIFTERVKQRVAEQNRQIRQYLR